jgi:hypothetical protein
MKVDRERIAEMEILAGLWACLSRAHGSFEGGETVIKGAENGNHTIGDGLTLLH